MVEHLQVNLQFLKKVSRLVSNKYFYNKYALIKNINKKVTVLVVDFFN